MSCYWLQLVRYVVAHLEDERVALLVDTGSQVSLLKSECLPRSTRLLHTSRLVQGVTGGLVGVKGVAEVDLRLGHKTTPVENVCSRWHQVQYSGHGLLRSQPVYL